MPEIVQDITSNANCGIYVRGFFGSEGQELGVGRIVSRKASHSWGQLKFEGTVVPGHIGKGVEWRRGTANG